MKGVMRKLQRCALFLSMVALLILAIWISERSFAEPLFLPQSIPLYRRENIGFIFLLLSLSAVFASLVSFLARRPASSVASAVALIAVIGVGSKIKFAYLKSKLLFPDIYFNLVGSELSFFWNHYTSLVASLLLTLLTLILALALVFHFERLRVSRLSSLAFLMVALISLKFIGAAVMTENAKSSVFWRSAYDDRHVSSFILSAVGFSEAIGKPMTLSDAPSGTSTEKPWLNEVQQADGERPNIITILHESSIDPGIYFEGGNYAVQPAFFKSGDGKRRRLYVETYGGRTWISEYGLLLGMDTSYLGSRDEFLGFIGPGKFQNTLPMELRRLGYLTVADYISPKTFMNTGIFYPSIGFDIVNGDDDLKLYIQKESRPRDRAYYEFVLRDLAIRKTSDRGKPVFYLVWTSATHYPYSVPMFPETRADEITEGDPIGEYARRQRIAADDLEWFESSLKKNFPDQKFMIVGFGDHHPLITADYINSVPSPHIKKRDADENLYETYFRVNGVNFLPDYSALSDKMEMGFMADSILEAARLPISEPFLAKAWLRKRCGGLWHDCTDHDALKTVNSILSTGTTSLFTREN